MADILNNKRINNINYEMVWLSHTFFIISKNINDLIIPCNLNSK